MNTKHIVHKDTNSSTNIFYKYGYEDRHYYTLQNGTHP